VTLVGEILEVEEVLFNQKHLYHYFYKLRKFTDIKKVADFRIVPLAAFYYMGVSSIILGASSAISILMPEKIAGRWPGYGREYYAQWNSFKRYVEDFSLIKEYPPESVNLWNRYIVYATALGSTYGVKKAMEFSLPKDILRENDIYMFQYNNDPTSALTNAINSALESD
jgi:uncharacterized membrane protein